MLVEQTLEKLNEMTLNGGRLHDAHRLEFGGEPVRSAESLTGGKKAVK